MPGGIEAFSDGVIAVTITLAACAVMGGFHLRAGTRPPPGLRGHVGGPA